MVAILIICLVNGKWRAKAESGYHNPESAGCGEIDHAEIPPHGAKWRGQQAAGAVSMLLSGLEHGFFANDTFTVYGLRVIKGVVDLPVAGIELYRILTLVLNGNLIGKGKLDPVVFVVRAFKTSGYRYFYASCNL